MGNDSSMKLLRNWKENKKTPLRTNQKIDAIGRSIVPAFDYAFITNNSN